MPKDCNIDRQKMEKTVLPLRDNYQAETVIGQASLELTKKIYLTVKLEGAPCQMEVDTGSSMSLVSWSTTKTLVPTIVKKRLRHCYRRLQDYQGNNIPILGSGKFQVKFKDFVG